MRTFSTNTATAAEIEYVNATYVADAAEQAGEEVTEAMRDRIADAEDRVCRTNGIFFDHQTGKPL